MFVRTTDDVGFRLVLTQAIRIVSGPSFVKQLVWPVVTIRNHPATQIPLADVFSAVCARLSTELCDLTRDGRPSHRDDLTRVLPSLFHYSRQAEQVNSLTYIPAFEGWLLLAVVADLFSRRIVGGAMDARMTSRLVVDALAMAVSRRGPVAGVNAHSDRRSQSASDHFRSELRRYRMVGSMSGVGQCRDHAAVESPFGRMKVELVRHERYAKRDEAKASIFEYIEVFFNRVRRHSTLESMTPDEFERTHNPNIR